MTVFLVTLTSRHFAEAKKLLIKETTVPTHVTMINKSFLGETSIYLQKFTFAFVLLLWFFNFCPSCKSGSNSNIKDFSQAHLSISRAFQVFDCMNLLCSRFTEFSSNWSKANSFERFHRRFWISQLHFRPNKHNRSFRATTGNFVVPFISNVHQWGWFNYREANDKNIRAWITERSEFIILFRTSSVP